MHFDMASAGHWYGHGEATTDDGGPYTDQPWPLDSGKVADDAFGPASYQMVDPFWFTQSAAGHLLRHPGPDERLARQGHGRRRRAWRSPAPPSLAATFFVEKHAARRSTTTTSASPASPPRATPSRTSTRPRCGTPGRSSTRTSTRRGFLDYVHRLHDAGVPGHTMSLDDGWMSHYGDFTFNAKFPDPKAMSDEVHDLGYNFGLWVTLWINLDADNYKVAADKGYLLKSKDDPSQAVHGHLVERQGRHRRPRQPRRPRLVRPASCRRCRRSTASTASSSTPASSTRRCAPAQGYTATTTSSSARSSPTSSTSRASACGSTGPGRRSTASSPARSTRAPTGTPCRPRSHQDLAVSTIGYPFVETDMVGGSLGKPPPTKEVLVRWAQAAAAMPLVYSSTSPVRVYDYGEQEVGRRTTRETVEAVRARRWTSHKRLAPYILRAGAGDAEDRRPDHAAAVLRLPVGPRRRTRSATSGCSATRCWPRRCCRTGTSRDVHLPPGAWYDVTRGKVVHGDLHAYPADLGTLPLFVRMGTSDTKSLIKALRH